MRILLEIVVTGIRRMVLPIGGGHVVTWLGQGGQILLKRG